MSASDGYGGFGSSTTVNVQIVSPIPQAARRVPSRIHASRSRVRRRRARCRRAPAASIDVVVDPLLRTCRTPSLRWNVNSTAQTAKAPVDHEQDESRRPARCEGLPHGASGSAQIGAMRASPVRGRPSDYSVPVSAPGGRLDDGRALLQRLPPGAVRLVPARPSPPGPSSKAISSRQPSSSRSFDESSR